MVAGRSTRSLGVIVKRAAPQIATTSIEEGLDFAASLLARAVDARARIDSTRAPDLAAGLAQYISFRYVGELQLALEMICDLGNMCGRELTTPEPFWRQAQWIAERLELKGENYSTLAIPTEYQQQ